MYDYERQQGQKNTGKSQGIGHYVLGKAIGKGTFGKVKLAIHTVTGEKVAVKILEKSRIKDSSDIERVSREIKILKLVNHPNVVKLYEIIETPKHIYLIMEYAPCGELFDYIVARSKLSEDQACHFLQQALSGLEYLHKVNVIHRDLKPENLLLDENNNIKIVDFGLSFLENSNDMLKTACGSPCYAAPEMIAGKRYRGRSADVWSCGIILFAMVCGYLPFEDPNTSQLYKKIMAGHYKCARWVSPDAQDLLKRVLNVSPEARFTLDRIRSHPWFMKYAVYTLPKTLSTGEIYENILKSLPKLGLDIDYTRDSLTAGKYNSHTATYFILLKKTERENRVAHNQAKISQRSSVNPRIKRLYTSDNNEDEANATNANRSNRFAQATQRIRVYAQSGSPKIDDMNNTQRAFRGIGVHTKNRISVDLARNLVAGIRAGTAVEAPSV
jgi:5'-AMP-activated protein kinase catalytic alpha subunit